MPVGHLNLLGLLLSQSAFVGSIYGHLWHQQVMC